MALDLYTYHRSSAAFRVRIALEWKGLAATHHAINLREGEQRGAAYAAINPQQRVPALAVEGEVLTQSLAIIEYLDEAYPDTPPLVWGTPLQRARIRSLSLLVACDIHPINNLQVLEHLRREFGQDDNGIKAWCRQWIGQGLAAFEAELSRPVGEGMAPGKYCVGDQVSLADVVLVPQIYNARRFGLDLDRYPQLMWRTDALMKLEAFQRAEPSRQPDAN